MSDCYVVQTEEDGGHLYVWDGDSWEDVGKFAGKDGEDGEDALTVWMHFSKVENPTSLADLSESPNKYIATITQLEKPAEADWLAPSIIWKQFTGNDGWGYEYAFINTSDSTVPLVK